MKRGVTEIFSELGRRLRAFAEAGGAYRSAEGKSAVGEAVTSSASVVAARNLAADMLSHEVLEVWQAGWRALCPALPAAQKVAGTAATKARNVLIITAGNVPFVGLHDLICVLAAGHRAIVKPSSKDFENMAWVVGQLLDIEPSLPVSLVDPRIYGAGGFTGTANSPGWLDFRPDAVVAMGRDEAVTAIRAQFSGAHGGAEVPMLLRGNRSSLAVLSGCEGAEELAGLADDVLLYSGLGCRNVSLVFVPCGYDFSELQQIMVQRESGVDLKCRNNRRNARALLKMSDTPYLDCGACLMVENRDFPAEPSVLYYAFYDTLSEVTEWIAQHDSEIQCVATGLPLPHPRAVALGATQRPGLSDYPDGRDTMRFLAEI